MVIGLFQHQQAVVLAGHGPVLVVMIAVVMLLLGDQLIAMNVPDKVVRHLQSKCAEQNYPCQPQLHRGQGKIYFIANVKLRPFSQSNGKWLKDRRGEIGETDGTAIAEAGIIIGIFKGRPSL